MSQPVTRWSVRERTPAVDDTWFGTLNALGISLILLLEFRASVFRRVFTDSRRMQRNLAFLVAGMGAALLLHRVTGYLYGALPRLSWDAPLWLQVPLTFLLAELMSWGLHWAKHKNNYLWRFHCQHHRDDRYTVWLVAHTYAPEVVLSGSVIAAAMVVCGMSRIAFDSYLLFYSLANLYQHSALPHSLGWLDRLIVNPAFHRQHHAGEQVNFGSTLTVWDWVFRTARWPASRQDAVNPPPIEQTPEPFGFVDEMLYPLQPSRWVDSRVRERRTG